MPKRTDFEDTLYNPEWLRLHYATMSAPQIAEMLGCTRGAVLDNLRKHGIPIEPRRFARHVGSNAPRPRGKFKATLHNREWVEARAHLNASEIAREAGCSVPSAQEAMLRFGVEPPGISGAKAGRSAPHKHKAEGEPVCRTTSSRRANVTSPEGSCVVCGEPSEHVNHIDRNWQNNDSSNLERLCSPCHRAQHACEALVAFEMLASMGVAYRVLHEKARTRIISGEYKPGGRAPGKITIDGVTKIIGEWALENGLREATVRRRLEMGWDPKRAVSEPVHAPEKILIDGQLAFIIDHARRLGIDAGNVYSRISQGWDVERALKTPMR